MVNGDNITLLNENLKHNIICLKCEQIMMIKL